MASKSINNFLIVSIIHLVVRLPLKNDYCLTAYSVHFRFGRLKIILTSLTFHIFTGFISAFSPNFWVFFATRFIAGLSKAGLETVIFTMASEYVGGKYRPLCGMLLWLAYASSLVVLGVKAYFIRNWKILFIACTIPYVFTLAFFR